MLAFWPGAARLRVSDTIPTSVAANLAHALSSCSWNLVNMRLPHVLETEPLAPPGHLRHIPVSRSRRLAYHALGPAGDKMQPTVQEKTERGTRVRDGPLPLRPDRRRQALLRLPCRLPTRHLTPAPEEARALISSLSARARLRRRTGKASRDSESWPLSKSPGAAGGRPPARSYDTVLRLLSCIEL